MQATELEAIAQAMYDRVNAKWLKHGPDLFQGACGFSILSGTPTPQPDLMIIGANPGFGEDGRVPHVEKSWPDQPYAETAEWTLARKLRSIFGEAKRLPALYSALQTNFLFFKSSSISRRPSRYVRADIDQALREDLESFCAAELLGLIAYVQPRLVLVLGTSVFKQQASDVVGVLRDRSARRDLLLTGKIGIAEAVGILHPSGAQVAAEDWRRVSVWLEGALPLRQTAETNEGQAL